MRFSAPKRCRSRLILVRLPLVCTAAYLADAGRLDPGLSDPDREVSSPAGCTVMPAISVAGTVSVPGVDMAMGDCHGGSLGVIPICSASLSSPQPVACEPEAGAEGGYLCWVVRAW